MVKIFRTTIARALLGLLAAMAVFVTPVLAADQLAVMHLRCEYLENPLGIETTRPRLSWIITSDQRGQKQTAYQVLVASCESLLAQERGDLWDSGKVLSSQSVHVEYQGTPLTSEMQCFWKVRVWGTGQPVSAWSEPALWTMGLLQAEEWQAARWIGEEKRAMGYASPLPLAIDGRLSEVRHVTGQRRLFTPRGRQ